MTIKNNNLSLRLEVDVDHILKRFDYKMFIRKVKFELTSNDQKNSKKFSILVFSTKRSEILSAVQRWTVLGSNKEGTSKEEFVFSKEISFPY